jgi:hypothetical protein
MGLALALAMGCLAQEQKAVTDGQPTAPAGVLQSAGTAPQPANRMGICAFQLSGAGFLAGTETAAGGYFDEIGEEVQGVYETLFAENPLFARPGDTKPVWQEDGDAAKVAEAIARNRLGACVSAMSTWGAKVGWNKRLVIATKWEVVGGGRCKFRVSTYAESQETHGKFPKGADPALKPAYLDVAKADARQFLKALPGAMEKARCVDADLTPTADSSATAPPAPAGLAPSRVALRERIAVSGFGEISLRNVVMSVGPYQVDHLSVKVKSGELGISSGGHRATAIYPLNRNPSPENDGVLVIVVSVLMGWPADLWKAGIWITDDHGQRNAKEDMAALADGPAFVVLFNLPAKSRKVALHIGDATALDLEGLL